MGRVIQPMTGTPISVSESWEPLIEHQNISVRSAYSIDIANWNINDLSQPFIRAGSTIEVNGRICYFKEDTEISGIENNGIYYIAVDITDGVSAKPIFTPTPPTFNAEKGGFYSTDTIRYTGHFLDYFSEEFRAKRMFLFNDRLGGDGMELDADGRIYIDSFFPLDFKGSYHSITLDSGETHLLSRGITTSSVSSFPGGNATTYGLQIYDGANWQGSIGGAATCNGSAIGDTVNYRFKAGSYDISIGFRFLQIFG